jgi:hypothetical protein
MSTEETDPSLDPDFIEYVSTGTTNSSILIDYTEYMSTQRAITLQQCNDGALLTPVLYPLPSYFSTKLAQWAQQGYPASFTLFSTDISPPTVCEDGAIRNIYEYLTYLLGKDVGEKVFDFQNNFQDLVTTYTISNNTFSVLISKP